MHKGIAEPSYRKRVGYQAGLLGGMALFASAALVLGDLRTRDDIAARKAEDLRASLQQVIPAKLHDNDLLADTLRLSDAEGHEVLFYRARKQGVATAAAFQMVGQGYAGDIVLVIGVDAGGRVLGVRVVQHAETPGLGDKIEIEKAPWIESFNGRQLGHPQPAGWAVKKDGGEFDQFSGATITPRAVVRAVHTGLQLFGAHRAEILSQEEDEQ